LFALQLQEGDPPSSKQLAAASGAQGQQEGGDGGGEKLSKNQLKKLAKGKVRRRLL